MDKYLPELCCRLQEPQEAGNHEEAQNPDLYPRRLSKNAVGKYGVAGVRAAMDRLGYQGGNPRNPLPPLSGEARATLQKEGLHYRYAGTGS